MWLVTKYCKKQPKIIQDLHHQKILFYFCLCIKMNLLFSLQEHGKKNDVQVVEYGGEIWINQKRLKKKTW